MRRPAPASLLAILLLAALAPATPFTVAASDPTAVTQGNGESVTGAWTWASLPAHGDLLSPANARPTGHQLTYEYQLLSNGFEHYQFTLDLGTGIEVSCAREPGKAPSSGLGAGTVTLSSPNGKTNVSTGVCNLTHPWTTGLLPREVRVSYRGNFTDGSCDPGRLPNWLPPPLEDREYEGLSLTCHGTDAGNLQSYEGNGVFFAHHQANGTKPPTGDVIRSTSPWQKTWFWRKILLDRFSWPYFGEDASLDFAHTPEPEGLSYAWTVDLSLSNLAIDCLRDATAPGGTEGTAFLRPSKSSPALKTGGCTFEPIGTTGRWVHVTTTFPDFLDFCTQAQGFDVCDNGVLPLTDDVTGDGTFQDTSETLSGGTGT